MAEGATFPIVPAKTALLFFDVLNTYLHPADPAAQAAIDRLGVIPKMQQINAAARAAGIAVFYAQADHRTDLRDFVPQVVDLDHDGTPGEGRARLTVGGHVREPGFPREIIAEVAPQPNDYIIKKKRWSSFFQTPLELSLRAAGIDTIVLAGGAIEVGLGSTAYAARDQDFNQIILRDACTSTRPETFEVFMNFVFPRFCRVMTVDETIAQIQR